MNPDGSTLLPLKAITSKGRQRNGRGLVGGHSRQDLAQRRPELFAIAGSRVKGVLPVAPTAKYNSSREFPKLPIKPRSVGLITCIADITSFAETSCENAIALTSWNEVDVEHISAPKCVSYI